MALVQRHASRIARDTVLRYGFLKVPKLAIRKIGGSMSDALTGFLGAALMIAFLVLIAIKLNELALWIVVVIGIALMLWAYWTDALGPILGRGFRPD
jgi:hypothetical protein